MWLVVACGVVTLGGGGVLLVVGQWLLQHPETRCHDTKTQDQTCEVWDMTGQDNGRDTKMIQESPYSQLYDTVNGGAASTVYSFVQPLRGSDSQVQEENLAQRLQRSLTEPTASCRKLVRIGGRSCLGAYDGAKVSK